MGGFFIYNKCKKTYINYKVKRYIYLFIDYIGYSYE